jgi:TolB-like protein/Flp pilus assembly protein TadD
MAAQADVFVSYSREDKDKVLAVIGELKQAGISVWIDQGGIDAATNWGEEIVNAIENCKVLLLMISESSVGSQNVMREVMLVSEKKKHILPVHLTPTTIPPTLKYPLAGIQHVEYFHGSQSENLNTIVRSLQRVGVVLNPMKKDVPVAIGETVSQQSVSSHSTSSEMPEEWSHTIAILPFENLSPDKETDYFSDGLTEELIASLSNIKEIEVISRRASTKYKGTDKDDRTIGRELGARYLCGGSVRKFQDNLRITAQLVDAEKGKQLWANTYKGGLQDVFDIQENVSKEIAEALKLKLSITEKVSLTKRPTLNAEAFDLYLRGKDYLYRFTKRNVQYAIELFEKAIELDSRYAAAFAGCSEAYGQLYHMFDRKEEWKEKAQELSLKALMYDNTLPEAYATMGLSYYFRQQFDEARSACEKAIELDPDNFLPYWLLGRINYSTDRYEEALDLFKKVLSLKPDFYATYTDIKICNNALGRTAEAEEALNALLGFMPGYVLQHPDDGRARMIYAINLASVGREAEAKREGDKAVELSPDDPLMMYNAACLFAKLGDVKRSVKLLGDAIAAGNHNFEWMKRDSDLDSIRSDPEYIALMKDK